MTITFEVDPADLRAADLHAFFNEWRIRPSVEALDAMLAGSYRVVLAKDGEEIVGFANAISDGRMFAYIPLVEVHPDRRGTGIGTELMRALLRELEHLHGVDLTCDDDLVPFYERVGLQRWTAMISRKNENSV